MARFYGRPRVEFINGHTWLLLEDFAYDSDLLKRIVVVPAGFLTDFASVPRGLWNILPKTEYGQAAVVHDFLCRYGEVTRKEADLVFKEALEHLGASSRRVKVMYWGVRIGAAASYLKGFLGVV